GGDVISGQDITEVFGVAAIGHQGLFNGSQNPRWVRITNGQISIGVARGELVEPFIKASLANFSKDRIDESGWARAYLVTHERHRCIECRMGRDAHVEQLVDAKT